MGEMGVMASSPWPSPPEGKREQGAAGLVFVGKHHGDRGARVVYVEGATDGDQLDQAGAVVVVADIEGVRQAVRAARATITALCFADGKAEHPDNIPKAASFTLGGEFGRLRVES